MVSIKTLLHIRPKAKMSKKHPTNIILVKEKGYTIRKWIDRHGDPYKYEVSSSDKSLYFNPYKKEDRSII